MKTIKITINHTTFLQKRSFLNSKVYIIILLFIIYVIILKMYFYLVLGLNVYFCYQNSILNISSFESYLEYVIYQVNNNIKHHATILNQNIDILRKTK